MSGTDRLCSDGDRRGVYDHEECQKAADAMDYQYKDARERFNYPRGCYLLHDTKLIYFNYHSIGQENNNAEQVCKGKGK